jgi:hypothetical protein
MVHLTNSADYVLLDARVGLICVFQIGNVVEHSGWTFSVVGNSAMAIVLRENAVNFGADIRTQDLLNKVKHPTAIFANTLESTRTRNIGYK